MTNIQDNNIHILYKKLGETPLECLLDYKKTNPEYFNMPMTYAGRLDPMAEGLLLVLSGETTKRKEEFLRLKKVYEFEVLWEFKTDTEDILGDLFTTDISIFPTTDQIQKEVDSYLGKFEQLYPAFSSQPVNGKPLILWAREGKINEIKIPSHEVEIYKSEYISRRFILGKDLLDTVLERISLVSGDFRQTQISNKWKDVLADHQNTEYAVDKIRMEVSGGFYVRQFVADLSKKLNVQATTFHILRTQVGDYKLE